MAQDNLISIELTPAELTALDGALTTIETTLNGKVVNLTAEDRRQYGKINNKRENWVTKVRNYLTQRPSIKPNSLNLAEHDKDLAARTAILPRLNRILAIKDALQDTAMLISSDLYDNSLAVYGIVKEQAKRNEPGITPIYDDLKAQFPGRGPAPGPVPAPAPVPTPPAPPAP